MKVLISTDIEGVAGVFHAEQVRPGNGEYERARAWMTGEANAAIAGAIAGGAEEVLVNDSHGGFRNLLPDQLDERARLVLGKPRYLGMMGGLEEPCDAVFMIGYHSRSQGRGVLAHTINSFAFARVFINGMELGEAGLYGALAGELGVPVALASGDDVFIAETRPLFPAAQWVQTKVAHGQGSGVTLTPAAARRAIAQAAETAVRNLDGLAPLRIAAPIECRLQTQGAALADLFCTWPTLERVDGVTLRFTVDSMQAAIRTLNSLAAMSFMLR
ncbi:M55 family metallopeptidase [Bordetella bronchiseptica]|uniref:M55 family metallopeptidase n=1 Tax=Bordetella bronchiseptica TaxID=518 RepID=UPI00028BA8FF|nr:M55 family metallopeptidase [Bordetella bronchiseptica]KCV24756.1 D-stereospecific aminopeptidase [Bordetella bronchiseptica 00-P-2730]KDD60144.1 D-stereospecific aminopeptidase [Bordetella bronchiseptica OSU553]AWQ06514.1 aminopeptidase [Bordetella bronchiseptica]AZW32052.1 aminopeptidase [Bordetella bronchiseptica]KAK54553.1 D-stereospecific aminopeptidase [Bordetella bronchiseptica OSU054]